MQWFRQIFSVLLGLKVDYKATVPLLLSWAVLHPPEQWRWGHGDIIMKIRRYSWVGASRRPPAALPSCHTVGSG